MASTSAAALSRRLMSAYTGSSSLNPELPLRLGTGDSEPSSSLEFLDRCEAHGVPGGLLPFLSAGELSRVASAAVLVCSSCSLRFASLNTRRSLLLEGIDEFLAQVHLSLRGC